MSDKALFCDGHLSDVLRAQEKRVQEEVDAISADQMVSLSEEQIVEFVISKVAVRPLVLFEEEAALEQRESQVDVSGDSRRAIFPGSGPVYIAAHEAKVSIPFNGDPALWSFCPDSFRTVFPYGDVLSPTAQRRGVLVITIVQPADEPSEQIKQRLDGTLSEVRFYVGSQKGQVEKFNTALPERVRQHVAARKQRLEAQRGIQKLLGIPLKRRDGVPNVEPVNLKRQLVRPLPTVPMGGIIPEPGITDQDYAHILSVIRHEGRTFETTPKTYAKHDEPDLRNILMAHLNGHYQGAATGETFRGNGKTDIRIEEKGRAAFVAECKVWRGPAELTLAIGQLLGYLTWRDCKTALVIFNKENAKFSELLEKVPAIVKGHPQFRRVSASQEAGEWRFTMAAPGDDGREITVHAFAFNLYV